MDIRQSVFGEVAIHAGIDVSGVDLQTLLIRLLMFETVIVRSIRLREIPFLVRALGKSGFLRLVESGALKVSCEFTSIIGSFASNGIRALPPFHFTFGLVDAAHRKNVLKSELRALQSIPGLKNAERESMEETVLSGLVRPPSDYGSQLLAQVDSDMRSNTPALRAAVEERLRNDLADSPRSIEIRVEESESRIFRVVNNLQTDYGISEEKTHDILQSAVFAVARLNQRISDMAAYSSITSFAESEAPLLFGKFAGIIAPQNPKPIEEQFARVISIANLPELGPGKRLDVEKLLIARQSPECREIRAWLSKLAGNSDQQVAEMISGIRAKLGPMIQSGSGKILRLAATTVIGSIPVYGIIGGAIAGALDSFLVDKVFPNSGVVAFLSNTYPSLFESD